MDHDEKLTVRFELRLAPGFVVELDNWRCGQRPVLSRAEAMRRLAAMALANPTQPFAAEG